MNRNECCEYTYCQAIRSPIAYVLLCGSSKFSFKEIIPKKTSTTTINKEEKVRFLQFANVHDFKVFKPTKG